MEHVTVQIRSKKQKQRKHGQRGGRNIRRAQGGETFMGRRWSVSAVCDAQMDHLNMEKSKNTDLVIKSHWDL